MTNFINKIPSNSKLLLAISGGSDSVFLLHQLLPISQEKNLTLNLAHLNHNLRGKDSAGDEKFIRSLAKKFKLPLTVKKIPISKLKSKPSEDELRQWRYRFLEQTRRHTKSDFILTAHNYDDQIETIFFNFIRGASARGLTGMRFKHKKILRPLLDTKKSEILAYLKKNELPFRNDRTNQDLSYTRNFIRHALIPLINQINPNIYQTSARLVKILRTQNSFLRSETIKFLQNHTQESIFPVEKWSNFIAGALKKNWPYDYQQPLIVLPLPSYKSIHHALQSEVLRFLLHPLVPKNKQLSYKNISEIRRILLFSRGNSQKILFNTLSIRKKNGKILLYKLPSE